MSIAEGVNQRVVGKKQTGKGTPASGASGGQVFRRTNAKFKLQKETYTTEEEMTQTQQLISNRHGGRMIPGSINGIFSPGTYADLVASVLRRLYAAVTAITGVGITVAGTGPSYTLTRAAGSWLTDGFKNGMVIRLSVGALNAANISKNLLILNISSATQMTVMPLNNSAMVAEGPITGCTVSVPGKVNYIPDSGHTKDYWTFEVWNPDAPSSEVNTDVVMATCTIRMPGTGNATIEFSAIGLDQLPKAATAYFSAPTAESTTESLIAASGLLIINGVSSALVTDSVVEITGNAKEADVCAGSNVRPDVFRGMVMVSGTITVYFDGITIPNLYANESDVSLILNIANGNGATADFVSIAIPKLNFNDEDPEDGETGLKRTYQFVGEYNAAGGSGTSTHKTTLQIQDSQA